MHNVKQMITGASREYVSPECSQVEMRSVGMLCASTDPAAIDLEGFGTESDFNGWGVII